MAARCAKILGGAGPAAVHITARAAGGERIETAGDFSLGRTVVVRGTVPEGIRSVQRNGWESVAVKDGRFEITLPETPLELVARGDDKRTFIMHHAELHCDAEVHLTKEALEIVRGGCPEGAAAWKRPEIPVWEEIHSILLDFKDGALGPAHRTARHLGELPESPDEDKLPAPREGVLQVRGYAENGALVFRGWQQLQMVGTGCILPTTTVFVDVPATAALVEIKGWSAQTSGRFAISEIPVYAPQ